MNENDVIIDVKDLHKSYGQTEVIKGVDMTVRKGEVICIIGPSGAGKSTILRCLNGLEQATGGKIVVNGHDLTDSHVNIDQVREQVGMVFQHFNLFNNMSVIDNITLAPKLVHHETDEQARAHAMELLKTVGLAEKADAMPKSLSGGQKQRVALAGVMVDDVDVLLFDEPLANLDPATGKQAVELIDEIQEKTGAAVIIIEHRLEDVLHRHVDRVVLMGEGRIIADVSPDELLSSSLLSDSGIREPLYITALKYAGVEIKADMAPASLDTIKLTEEQKERVRGWFRSRPETPARGEKKVLLEAKDISFAYDNGHQALKDVSLTVYEGELMAIAGTNGAGKSTFSKLICGFGKQQQGSLSFAGRDLMEMSIKERADHIGYVMQNPNQMISKVMIYDEVALGLRTRGLSEEEIIPRVEETLKICGLWPFRNWPVSALSFGQKKRVTIASILVLKPEMIILDEPTAGQDYRHYTEIMEFLRGLNEQGITVVMITHDMHLMLEYAGRAVVFSGGRVIADDSSARILTDSEVIRKASLKETSLYPLSQMCGIEDGRAFVQRFIDYEREAVRK